VGVDVTDYYQTYFDTQFISRCNWYPLFYWTLEAALINSLIIYCDLTANTESTVEHSDFHLSIVHDHLQAGSPSTIKCFSSIPALQAITRSALSTLVGMYYLLEACILQYSYIHHLIGMRHQPSWSHQPKRWTLGPMLSILLPSMKLENILTNKQTTK